VHGVHWRIWSSPENPGLRECVLQNANDPLLWLIVLAHIVEIGVIRLCGSLKLKLESSNGIDQP
jgi:hypothetical protein